MNELSWKHFVTWCAVIKSVAVWMTFFLLQHSFIQEAKSVSILNNMIQEALNIMEEESAREENEVRCNVIPVL